MIIVKTNKIYKKNNVAIIGGGASGLALSIFLKRYNIDVDIFEKDDEVLKKLKASGNGRSNFTNKIIDGKYYTGDKAFIDHIGLFSYDDCVEFFKSLGVLSTSLESGRVYPITMQSKTVVDALRNEALDLGVNFYKNVEIKKAKKEGDYFILYGDKIYKSSYLVLANGGLKGISKNSRSNGYDLARNFGHDISKLTKGITSFSVKEKDKIKNLNGVKEDSKLNLFINGRKVRSIVGDVLFRNYGVSGLSVLQVSNDASIGILNGEDVSISIDLLYQFSFQYIYDFILEQINRSNRKKISCMFSGIVNEKIVERVLKNLRIQDRNAKEVSKKDIKRIINELKNFTLNLDSPKDGEQVTIGGVKSEKIKDNLESSLIEGLFFTGEILNIQGESGGYNLHWAWTSSKIVSKSIYRRENE